LVLLDVLAKQSFVRLSVEALSPRVGALLPKEGVEFARKNEPNSTAAANPFDDALVQKVRKPIFEILR
jgi:hypothetical protein